MKESQHHKDLVLVKTWSDLRTICNMIFVGARKSKTFLIHLKTSFHHFLNLKMLFYHKNEWIFVLIQNHKSNSF